MAFPLTVITEEDIYDDLLPFLDGQLASFLHEPIHHAVYPGPATPSQLVKLRERILPDARAHYTTYIKITDAESGKMAAGARWKIYNDEAGAEMPQRAIVDWCGEPGSVERQWAQYWVDRLGREKLLRAGTRYMMLDVIWSLPEYRGRGFGTRLLEWGYAQSLELHLPIFIDLATQFSQRMYEAHGFKTLEVIRSDEGPPRPEMPVRVYKAMRRSPVAEVE